ncbi:hypothetical protein WDZ92_22530 [Nostoc sp. NIES-2111]
MATFLKIKIEPNVRTMINKYDLFDSVFSQDSVFKSLLDIAGDGLISAKIRSDPAIAIMHVDQAISVLQDAKKLLQATLSGNQGIKDDSA